MIVTDSQIAISFEKNNKPNTPSFAIHKLIANELGVSTKTVKRRLSKIISPEIISDEYAIVSSKTFQLTMDAERSLAVISKTLHIMMDDFTVLLENERKSNTPDANKLMAFKVKSEIINNFSKTVDSSFRTRIVLTEVKKKLAEEETINLDDNKKSIEISYSEPD